MLEYVFAYTYICVTVNSFSYIQSYKLLLCVLIKTSHIANCHLLLFAGTIGIYIYI